MKKVCLTCFNCKKIPLDPKYVKMGYKALLRCSVGHFDFCESENLPLFDPRAESCCPDFDGEPLNEDTGRQGGKGDGKSGYVNLADILPEDILLAILDLVDGPRMVYLPSTKKILKGDYDEELYDRIQRNFMETGSIRGTARMTNCSRNTVRSALRQQRIETGFGDSSACEF